MCVYICLLRFYFAYPTFQISPPLCHKLRNEKSVLHSQLPPLSFSLITFWKVHWRLHSPHFLLKFNSFSYFFKIIFFLHQLCLILKQNLPTFLLIIRLSTRSLFASLVSSPRFCLLWLLRFSESPSLARYMLLLSSTAY